MSLTTHPTPAPADRKPAEIFGSWAGGWVAAGDDGDAPDRGESGLAKVIDLTAMDGG